MGLGALWMLTAGLAVAEEPVATVPTAPAAEVVHGYSLDASQGNLWVIVKADRSTFMGRSFGHDHVIGATGWSGNVQWNVTDPSKCKVDIKVPVSGLVVDPIGARKVQGFKGDTSEGDKRKITENFQGDTQLQMSKYPNIQFSALSCSAASGAVKVTGNLTLRGVTRRVTADLTVVEGGGQFSATGGFSILHSDFGFQPFQAMGGKLTNENKLQFLLDVRGTATP